MSPIVGRIVSIRFLGHIKVARNKLEVPTPHWRGDFPDGAGSQRPAAFVSGVPATARVVVEITDPGDATGSGTLVGSLGGLTLRGELPLTPARHRVDVTLQGLTGSIARHAGDAGWNIESTSPAGSHALAGSPTRLEIFEVLGPPPKFFRKDPGVWCEALRFLVAAVGLAGVSNPDEVVERITEHCHSRHGLRYDSMSVGRNSYGVDQLGGAFDLTNFLGASKPEVSCFDMLAAVLVLSGAVGISLEWLTLIPFGFIKTANLVGIGPCNNPFFERDGTPAVIDQIDPMRSGFGSHGFCRKSITIFDACVGPHLSSTNSLAYLHLVMDPVNPESAAIPPASNIDVRSDPIDDVV